MAQLHGILRSLAWDRTGPPAQSSTTSTTPCPPSPPSPWPPPSSPCSKAARTPARGRWTSAGHPPPLLLTQDGQERYLEAGQGLLLGTPPGTGGGSRPNATEPLPPGSTLLLYTDGLIEVPGSDLDTGLARLRRHALALAHEPLDTLCDQLPARMPPGSTDDVALLALRLPSS
jgi:hypothetical protein